MRLQFIQTKQLLRKNPDDRPSIKDTVRCDLIRVHISKLLSHTLKVRVHVERMPFLKHV